MTHTPSPTVTEPFAPEAQLAPHPARGSSVPDDRLRPIVAEGEPCRSSVVFWLTILKTRAMLRFPEGFENCACQVESIFCRVKFVRVAENPVEVPLTPPEATDPELPAKVPE